MRNKLIKKTGFLATPLVFWGFISTEAAQRPEPVSLPSTTQQQDETVKSLQKLAQYEIDESFLFRQSIGNITSPALKEKLIALQATCEKDLQELSALVKKHGGAISEYSQDFKGYFMNGYAAMRGAFTDQGVLKALHTNLKLVQKAFESALDSTLPSDVKESIRKISNNKKKAIQDLEAQI